MASRSGGRNTAFRPQDRTITLVDDLDRMGCIGQDLHIATVDMEDETCLFRPLIVFCHIVIFSVRLSLFVSLGKRGIYELPCEVYINCLTQYISSGICSISSQKRPVERCLRRLLHASLIRARMLLTLLPFVIRGVMGRKRRMKRSLTISSGVIFSSFSCMIRMTWANSVTVRHSTICAR